MSNQTDEPTLAPGFIREHGVHSNTSPPAHADLDAALSDLQTSKDAWARLDLSERIQILSEILEAVWGVSAEWVALSVNAKGVAGNGYAVAEEWAFVTNVLRLVRLLRSSLEQIRASGRPLIPGPITHRSDGQIAARVFPQRALDRLLLPGTTAEVWMQPGVSIEEMTDRQARFYRTESSGGMIALVLGAGNASMLIASDVLSKLFVEGRVVILKLNPINAYLDPVLRRGFRALIERGFLRIVQGGAIEGTYLCHHPAVDEIHTTGSDKTYEDIVFGPGAEGARRKAERRPLLTKRFTAELGNVTPVIIVPDQWRRSDIQAQGERLARWLVINAGFNCLTPRVLVQWAGWPHREALNEAIRGVLAATPTRPAYYPRARERHQRYRRAHPAALQYGSASAPDHLPWTFIPGLNPDDTDDICFQNEPFCGLFAETALLADSAEQFLERAVQFVNNVLWGNLTATLVAHTRSLTDRRMGAAIERAVAELRYGMVLVNQFAGLGFFALTTTWGAFPGNDRYDIQSGIGVTSNVLMFDRPQKSVVRSPFRLSPDPFALTSRTTIPFVQQLARLNYQPRIGTVPKLIWYAMRS